MDRAQIVHENFLRRVADGFFPELVSSVTLAESGLSPEGLVSIFHSQVLSRHIDRYARKLKERGEGFYTIGSSGHEGNAAIAYAARVTDPAFLHYRGGAFQIARASKVPGQTPLWDMLLSLTSSSEDPISGGRHKVLGSKALNIPPQTSTIASHLPKAVGAAYSMRLTKQIKPEFQEWETDSVVLCSFGDASLNHSTAQGAINTACWTAFQGVPLPLVFICEDNGIGISTRTPEGWVQANMSSRPNLDYVFTNGLDVVETFKTASEVIDRARKRRKPAFLHMGCVRLYGHAGADVQSVYMSQSEIDAIEASDPLLHTARRLIENGISTANDVLKIYKDTDQRVARAAEYAVKRPKLKTSDQVRASLIPPMRDIDLAALPSDAEREALFSGADKRALKEPQHMAKLINFALNDLMLECPEIILCGEDVGRKGGVYGVTQRLHQRFGQARVVDTLLDEQSILGLSIGMAHNGLLPIPEIQFLAYLHNAEDQIRGEAATLPFFSNGQYTNPMVVRIAGLGYQRGFGGHFHNDNSLAVLRDIPGLIIALPCNGHDAALMLRECVRLAREEQRIVAFIEPIALYMTRDLHEEGDGGWMKHYPAPDTLPIKLGEVGIEGSGKDIAIVTYGNGVYLSRKAQKELEDDGVKIRVVDLRWIAPLPEAALLKAIAPCQSVLIVDECRQTGGQGEALEALIANNMNVPVRCLAAEDCFIPTGPAYAVTMPSVQSIFSAAKELNAKAQS